jgi:SNF2 family DNA or RNA helicase
VCVSPRMLYLIRSFRITKGLGKTIQGIASMAMYHQDWPLLVLCPSGARYHWENEFQQWLGVNSPINKPQSDDVEAVSDTPDDDSNCGALLEDSQIHVLTAAKDDVLPTPSTRVVICSYGLAPALVESGKIAPSTFPCAIVDESHMLKNKSTKRTLTLLPILSATHRCLLLSGTPALARPAELWPQLDIIGVARYGWWDSEAEFMEKYAKSGAARRLAELHTMLTGTVMIRRLKTDILKELPKKIREKAELNIMTHDQRHEFKEMMMELRQGKGALGQIAREEHAKASSKPDSTLDYSNALSSNTSLVQACAGLAPQKPGIGENCRALQESKDFVDQRLQTELMEGRNRIQTSLAPRAAQLPPDEYNRLAWQLDGQLLADLENKRRQGIQEIEARFGQNSHVQNKPEHESKRTTLLSRLYERTGNAKIPFLVDMLKRWLNDPMKGKLCIFAHHISVLDAIRDKAELSNEEDSKNKYIRIDGSTTPKLRQQQIKTFQTDPSTRIALLGITAAGVAVTLTASSTVWFAELFWTPAIMVQGKIRFNRCTRSGYGRNLFLPIASFSLIFKRRG